MSNDTAVALAPLVTRLGEALTGAEALTIRDRIAATLADAGLGWADLVARIAPPTPPAYQPPPPPPPYYPPRPVEPAGDVPTATAALSNDPADYGYENRGRSDLGYRSTGPLATEEPKSDESGTAKTRH